MSGELKPCECGNTKPELKPCYCESKNVHLMYDIRPISKNIYRVKCFDCGSRTSYYDKAEQAISAWNKRS